MTGIELAAPISRLSSFIRVAIRAARSAPLRPYVVVVIVGAACLAAGLGLEISRHLEFEYRGSGIVGWLSVRQYPKQREIFYYLAALAGVPAVISIYWLVWLAVSALTARWSRQIPEAVLRQNALASLPLFLILRGVYNLDRSWVAALALPVGLALAAWLGVLLWNVFRSKRLRAPKASVISPPPEEAAPRCRAEFGLRRAARVTAKYVLAPVFIYVLIYASYRDIHRWLDLYHEGEQLAPLNEMLRGGLPYRDIYVQHGLFENCYQMWLGSRFFGPTLEGLRRMEAVVSPLGFVALYFLGLQIFRGGVIASLILFVVASGEGFWVSPRHSLGLISFAFAAASISSRYRDRSKTRTNLARAATGPEVPPLKSGKGLTDPVRANWQLPAAGFSTGLAFWYSTEVGLYSLAAISLFLLVQGLFGFDDQAQGRRRLLPLSFYGAGVFAGFWLFGSYFVFHGALGDVFRNTHHQVANQMGTWGLRFYPLARALKPLSDSGWAAGWHEFVLSQGFRFYLPPFVFVVTAIYLTYRGLQGTFRHSRSCAMLLLLLLGGATFFRTALGRSEIWHVVYGATFLWILCLFFFDRTLGRIYDRLRSSDRNWRSFAVPLAAAASITLPILATLWYVGQVHHPLRTFQKRCGELVDRSPSPVISRPEIERAGLVDLPDDQAEQIRRVVSYIREHTRPQEPIFDFSNQGGYYFFADRPSVSRYHQVVYAATETMQRELVRSLEQHQTNLVIYKTGGWWDAVDGVPNEQRHPVIGQYLAKHYQFEVDIDGTQIWKRQETRSAAKSPMISESVWRPGSSGQ